MPTAPCGIGASSRAFFLRCDSAITRSLPRVIDTNSSLSAPDSSASALALVSPRALPGHWDLPRPGLPAISWSRQGARPLSLRYSTRSQLSSAATGKLTGPVPAAPVPAGIASAAGASAAVVYCLGASTCFASPQTRRERIGKPQSTLLRRHSSSGTAGDSVASRTAASTPSVAGMTSAVEPAGSSTTAPKAEAATKKLAPLFPPLEPYSTGMLKVSSVHSLYYEESGNPQGTPVIFVHGGPGGGTAPSNRRFFDPSFYRIVLVDQRGSGKSTPHASLDDNTTWHLVEDLEVLRKELKIQKWLVFGGSWGSTLSLAYSITHPDKVLGLVLRGVFLLRKKELIWFYQSGASILFPDVFEPYEEFIPEDERDDLVAAYHRRLTDDSNPDLQMAAARKWTEWEMRTSYLIPNEGRIKQGEDEKFALAFARIESHYFFNKGFFTSDNFLLENVHKTSHLPCVIIQGRYDVVCPFQSAWDLHKAWPGSSLKVVADAGHSANELGIASELVHATESFKNLLSR